MSLATRLRTLPTPARRALLAAGVTLAAVPAGAQPLTFSGTVNGCLYAIGKDVCTPTGTTSQLSGVSYTGGAIGTPSSTQLTLGSVQSNTNSTGFLALQFALDLPGSPAGGTLFTVDGLAYGTLYTPPGQKCDFVPFIGLTCTPTGASWSVTVATAPLSRSFTFSNAAGSGAFDLTFNPNTSFTNTATVNATLSNVSYSAVTAAVVPEPATWATLGAGLLALGGVARRRTARA